MSIRTEILTSLSRVDAAEWDALAGEDDPFVEHAFLSALEESGSVGEGTGWMPHHILCRKDGRLVGAIPLYLKEHSYGEYIFDWGWAEAARRARIRYYPKLVSAVPFTPASGHRLLVAGGEESGAIIQALVERVYRVAKETRSSSIHFLFTTEAERRSLSEEFGFLPRLTYQFHWENRGFTNFEDYLSAFRSQARKQVRKERRLAAESGLTLRTVRGAELSREEWSALYRFYRRTAAHKHAIPYLTAAFFEMMPQKLAHRVVVALASEGKKPIAGALAFQKGKHLYGRYWGALITHEMLHFELCYYQLIEFAITEKLSRFEAGAQGEHKLKRGFLPSPTYSAHWIQHPALSQAISDYLPREALAVKEEMRFLAEHGPFPRVPRAEEKGA